MTGWRAGDVKVFKALKRTLPFPQEGDINDSGLSRLELFRINW